jgi:TolB-like protein/DNA-binding SARP family transcriptional activator
MIELRTLGGIELREQGGRGLVTRITQPKRLALLAYLALAEPRGFQRRDSLVALFWPEIDAPHARAALRTALHHLRDALGKGVVATQGDEEIGLAAGEVWCDAAAFGAALEAGDLRAGLELYRGDLLQGLFVADAPEFERWLDTERDRLRARAVAAAWALSERLEAEGSPFEAERWARRAAALDSYDEEGLRRLMRLLDRLGDPAGAVVAYEEFARRVKADLELEPAPETKALLGTIRAPRSTPAASPAPAPPFSGSARSLEPAAPAAGSGTPPRALPWRIRGRMILAGGLALVAMAVALTTLRSSPRDRNTIVVLPFENLSGRPENTYFSDGITNDLVARLSGVGALKVISPAAVGRPTGAQRLARDIGAAMGAGSVLEGSVQRVADRVRVTAQLVDARSGADLWAATYDRDLKDVFAIQSDVALRIAGALRARLAPAETASLARRPTDNLEAYTDYLKGRYLWNARTEGSLVGALDHFRRAIAHDSAYALAYAGLADTYIILGNFRLLPPEKAYPDARRAALRALELDPTLGQARISLAFVKFLFDWDWRAAGTEFRQALASNPNYAPGHQWYGVYLAAMKQGDSSSAELRRAGELEPLSLTINAVAGWVAYLGRRYEEALAHCWRTVELAPNFALAHRYLAEIQGAAGRPAAAVAEAERMVQLDSAPLAVANLAWAYAVAGRRPEARRALQRLIAASRLRYVSPLDVAEIYGALGERRQAFTWLERAYRGRDPWLVLLSVEPKLDPLRGDPRFALLSRRVRAEP